MQNTENIRAPTAQNGTNNEAQASTDLICPMCGSRFTSNSLFTDHLLTHMAQAEHRVKLENGNEVGVSSTSAMRIKQEPDWLTTPRAKRPPPTYDCGISQARCNVEHEWCKHVSDMFPMSYPQTQLSTQYVVYRTDSVCRSPTLNKFD